MTELVVGKYEFHRYEREHKRVVTLDDLEELLKKSKGRKAKDHGGESRPDRQQKNFK